MKFRFGEQGQFFGVSCSGQFNGEFELLKIGFGGLAHGFGIVPNGIPSEKRNLTWRASWRDVRGIVEKKVPDCCSRAI